MSTNFALLNPKNRENLATVIRSGQNFNINTIFVIGGFVKEKYKDNIHKFDHQMNTQNGLAKVNLMYFESLDAFLKHLPAQTNLVVIETYDYAKELRSFEHPENATYLLGRETIGITENELQKIQGFFANLNRNIPEEYLGQFKKTAYLDFVKVSTPESLNLGVCASIVMYDKHSKLQHENN